MRFNEDKKQAIILYILEKISQNCSNLSKSVSKTFDVNQSTIHSYMKELINNGIITKIKRGTYSLVTQKYEYILSRSEGDLDNDFYAYDKFLFEHIKNFPQNVKSIWNYAFSEMINNVMDHSAAEEAKVVIQQDYLHTKVTIADNGVGIFKKIMGHFNLNNIDEAICELFKGKLTTDSKNHSGEGIFFTSKMMDDFYILSSSKIFSNNIYDNSCLYDIVDDNFVGTCLLMTLSNFSNKTPKEVFDLYANVDGNFIKTKIPLKNIFDTSPVSRSQAKRICNRLEKFKEVIIDFEDVSWIGQAFAHQLFVVFANEHKTISIIPINMNDDVKKMYNHVINY